MSLAESVGVELPIAETVRRVVWEDSNLELAAAQLFGRELKPEFY